MHRMFRVEAMWRLCIGLVLAAGMIAATTLKAEAKQSHSLPASTQEMAAQTVTINGTVKTVTESMLTVVDAEKGEHTISLDAKTRISKGGKVVPAAELKANDSVVVVASKGEGTLTAVTITVT